ncbi:MAG TPA: PP2C family serine/threonine-protein phosphatase [Verrucomicrobiae bacterium]|nr:PP2C family serine/threonine-protein phosphatase [Verrucomicrobiae bacterium]
MPERLQQAQQSGQSEVFEFGEVLSDGTTELVPQEEAPEDASSDHPRSSTELDLYYKEEKGKHDRDPNKTQVSVDELYRKLGVERRKAAEEARRDIDKVTEQVKQDIRERLNGKPEKSTATEQSVAIPPAKPKPAAPKPTDIPPKRPAPQRETFKEAPPKAPEKSRASNTLEKEKTAEAKSESVRFASFTTSRSAKQLKLAEPPRIRGLKESFSTQGLDWQDGRNKSLGAQEIRKWEAEVAKAERGNQDAIYIDASRQLFALADGAGGHKGGEVASKLAMSVFEKSPVLDYEPQISPQVVVADHLAEISKIRLKMKDLATEDASLQEMATTIVTAQVVGNNLIGVAAGDSRICVVRDGQPIWLNTEQIDPRQPNVIRNALSPGISHGQAGINVKSRSYDESFVYALEPGDRIVMMSDGVLGDWPEEKINAEALERAFRQPLPEDAMKALFEASKKYDDTSIIVFDFNPEGFEQSEATTKTSSQEAQTEATPEFGSFSGELPIDPAPPTTSRVTPPVPPVAPPPTAAETTAEFPRITPPEVFNAASLLREERLVESEEAEALRELTEELIRLATANEAEDTSKYKEKHKNIVDFVNGIGKRNASQIEYFNQIGTVKDLYDEPGNKYPRKYVKGLRKAANREYTAKLEGGQYIKNDEKLDGEKLLSSIYESRKEITKDLGRKEKRIVKDILRDIERLPAAAWVGADKKLSQEELQDRIEEEAYLLGRNNAEREAAKATLTSLVTMNQEDWERTVEGGQILQRNEAARSPAEQRRTLNEMQRNGMDVRRSPFRNEDIRTSRFLKYILDQVPETSERSSVEERPVTRDLSGKVANYLWMNGYNLNSGSFERKRRELIEIAKDAISAKELAEMPEQLVSQPRPSEYRKYGLSRDYQRESMTVGAARDMLQELYDANRLADEYEQQIAKVQKLERSTRRLPGSLASARGRLQRLEQRLNDYHIRNEAGRTRIVEER